MARRGAYSIVCLFALLAGAVTAGEADWIQELEIKSEPSAKEGEVHYTVRLAAARSHACDLVVFKLFYRQTMPWVDQDGKKSVKIHEPVFFRYQRAEVRLTAGLDTHISFRVPTDRAELDRIYGENSFHKKYPIVIERMRISGLSKDKVLWTCDVPADGKHDIPKLMAEKRAREEKEKKRKEDVSDLRDAPQWRGK
jgi:hypothetical protein